MRLSFTGFICLAVILTCQNARVADAKLGEKRAQQVKEEQKPDDSFHKESNLKEALPRLHLRDPQQPQQPQQQQQDDGNDERELQELVSYGGQPGVERIPLGLCEGDCDEDIDCDTGLICFQRETGGIPVPGCQGYDNARNDYCILDPSASTTPGIPSPTQPFPAAITPAPGPSPSLPTSTSTSKTLPRPTQLVPWPMPPAPTPLPPTPNLQLSSPTAPNNPVAELFIRSINGPSIREVKLQLCEGDCDSNDNCEGDLICFRRVANEPVPGCVAGSQVRASIDYCIVDPSINPTPSDPEPTSPTLPVPSPTLPAPSPTFPAPTPALPAPTSGTTLEPLALAIVGNNGFPPDKFPLQRCQGDCDSDEECAEGLICYKTRTAGQTSSVPGCLGVPTNGDFCIVDPAAAPLPTSPSPPAPSTSNTLVATNSPTSKPLPAPTLPPPIEVDNVASNGSPSWAYPLGLCQGDCDYDTDCATGLICYQRDSFQAVPGCLDGETDGSRTDYCIPDPSITPNPTPFPTPLPTAVPTRKPTASPTAGVTTAKPTGLPTPSPTSIPTPQPSPLPTAPLAPGTTAPPTSKPTTVPTAKPTAMPTLSPTSNTVVVRTTDIPVPLYTPGPTIKPTRRPTAAPTVTPPVPAPFHDIRIRLYWEQGYTWQDSTTEKFWCMMSDYRGKPGTGRCWVGEKTQPCNPDQVYVADCNSDKRQRFSIMFITHEKVMIKVSRDNRCFERTDDISPYPSNPRAIRLRPCDPTNEMQWWISGRGAFFQRRFEITSPSLSDYCATQEHHPKPGEVVWLEPCVLARHPLHQTHFWMRW